MVHDALGLQLLQVVHQADLDQLVEVLLLVHTVQKAEIHIVRAQGLQLPGEGFADGIKIPAPAVFALFVVDRAEVHLEKDLVPLAPDRPAKGLIHRAAGAEVKEIDAVFDGFADDGLDLCRGRMLDAAHTKAENAKFFPFVSVGKLPIFHGKTSLTFVYN